MLRVVTYLIVLGLICPAAWAQTNMTPAPSTFARKSIAQIINRLPGKVPTALPSAQPADNGIHYFGGPILDDANGVNVYYIWYGDWSKDLRGVQVLTNFIKHVGGSPYFNINTTYYSLTTSASGGEVVKDRVVNAVHYKGSTTDSYSQGTQLTDYQVYLAVANAITSGALPADPNGVYFLLTSADVNETSGFCTVYCGWHDSTADTRLPPVNGVDIKFSFVGNASAQCPYNCTQDYQVSLSGSLAGDGMASVVAHELEETTTDPDITSWLTADYSAENADLCAWTFGEPWHAGTAADPNPPNMSFGGIPYLIQQNWVNAKGGYCALRWDE